MYFINKTNFLANFGEIREISRESKLFLSINGSQYNYKLYNYKE